MQCGRHVTWRSSNKTTMHALTVQLLEPGMLTWTQGHCGHPGTATFGWHMLHMILQGLFKSLPCLLIMCVVGGCHTQAHDNLCLARSSRTPTQYSKLDENTSHRQSCKQRFQKPCYLHSLCKSYDEDGASHPERCRLNKGQLDNHDTPERSGGAATEQQPASVTIQKQCRINNLLSEFL